MVGPSDYRDILVICETRGSSLAKTSLEVLTKARELADQLGARVEALILGPSGVEDLAEAAIHNGADTALVAEDESLTLGNIDAFYQAILPVVKERKPEILLLSATALGLDLAPRLAATLGTGALSDSTKLEIDETDRLLVAKRLTYDGSVEAAATIPRARPQIASLRPGAIRPGYPDDSRYGRVEKVEVRIPRGSLKVKLVSIEDAPPQDIPLPQAEVVVTGGMGLGGKEDFKLAEDLATALGGAWGASRAAVHFGLAPEERQVGATGHHVAPKLYVALGVSGAFEHYLGMRKSSLVVAVNKDKGAPIFGVSHFGLIGDAKELVPKIIQELKRE